METRGLGPCVGGPVLLCGLEDILNQKITLADGDEIVECTVEGGEVIEQLVQEVKSGLDSVRKTPVSLSTENLPP